MRENIASFKLKVRKYLSGRLFLVQLLGGVGAFILRSLAAYMLRDYLLLSIISSLIGSFTGYIGVYIVGYWWFFRKNYRLTGRLMKKDIFGLQLVEQLPNVGTVLAAGLTHGVLVWTTGISSVLAANLASWFGPQKIINILAMILSNTLKRGWVDGSWKPSVRFQRLLHKMQYMGKNHEMEANSSTTSESKAPTEETEKNEN